MTKSTKKKPNEFRLRIGDVGTTDYHHSIERMTDKNAVKLLLKAMNCITQELVGKNRTTKAGCLLLASMYYLQKYEANFETTFPDFNEEGFLRDINKFDIDED